MSNVMNSFNGRRLAAAILVLAGLTVAAGSAWSARESNVRATKHNLSKDWYGGGTDPRTVKASSETQVCVFCHTPHGATSQVTPLWNKQLSGATYTSYSSSSLDAQAIAGTLAQPGGSSKLCLSCHDGTLALGNVNVLNGAGAQNIALTGTGSGGTMAPGSGTTTGFTRFLGTDLSNDHPISLTYNKLLTDRDGELRDATLNATDGSWEWVNAGTRVIGVRNHRSQGGAGQPQKPVLPLEKTGPDSDAGQVQCASCHDPHVRETDTSKGNQKFLRLNRFQETTPANAYSQDGDIICLACHNKNRGSGAWAYSAHANPLVATQTYTSTAATQREFPANMPVWKAACLNCHDTHSVPGSRRLLREGTTGVGSPKSGGSSAIEETCYQCHTTSAQAVITPVTTVPDIKTDFTTS
ncbi:MAG TPA: cytochrome c3 family protein, partial [Azospira sp.]|nr:cytochrome c3 family protein [Azospira sp.]